MINPFIIHHAIGGEGGGVADRIIDGPIYKTVKANDSVRTRGKNAFHILIEEEELYTFTSIGNSNAQDPAPLSCYIQSFKSNKHQLLLQIQIQSDREKRAR